MNDDLSQLIKGLGGVLFIILFGLLLTWGIAALSLTYFIRHIF